MPVYPYERYSAFLNKRISDTVTPLKYARSAFLALMLGVTVGNSGNELQINRPQEGLYLTGANVPAAIKEQVRGVSSFTQRLQGFKPSNTTVVGPMGSTPNVQNPTTQSTGFVGQFSAEWKWCQNIMTPIEFWNSDLQMAAAGSGKDGGIAMGTLLEEGIDAGQQEHYDQINSRAIYGAPTVQNAQVWDDISGQISSMLPTNTYAGIDRTQLASTSQWIPQYVSTSFPKDITRIVDYANTKLGINVYAGGVIFVLAGADNYLALKNQALARGGQRMDNPTKQGLPNAAQIGQAMEYVKCGNAIIAHEPFLDTCYGTDTSGNPLYTAQPGYVMCINPYMVKFITHPNWSMKMGELTDISKYARNAPMVSQAFITTWAVLQNLRPDAMALFTNLN